MSLFRGEDVDIIIHIYLRISLKMSIFASDNKGVITLITNHRKPGG